MKSLVFFNNKGGVGKTTLACNIAAYLSTEHNKRVLLIDADPQCNATQLMVDQIRCDELYGLDTDKEQDTATLSRILEPLEEGEITLNFDFQIIKASENRFNVDVIPGDPRISTLEDLLARWWTDGTSGDLGSLRRTNWVAKLLDHYGDDYDLAIFDVGPSLGALNRSILLGADYFVSPLGADTFSIVALRNIKTWIDSWGETYKQSITLCERRFPGKAAQHGVSLGDSPVSEFIGYTVQQYVTRSKQGVRRPTAAYDQILNRIPAEISSTLRDLAPDALEPTDLHLGDVPNLYSLIPLAQDVNAPIAGLSSRDGLAGGQFAQQKDYRDLMHSVGLALAKNLDMVNSNE